jgi:DNA invertase Pin-like site-specific DNA recombinase
MTRIVIVYERVSTDAQDISRQAAQCERAAADYPGVELRVIPDDGISAFKVSIFDRPGGRQLCDLIASGQVEAVYADAQDRLHRGDDDEWVTFRALCDANDTWIVVNGERYSRDMSGKVLSYLRAIVARAESEEKSHRVKTGMAHAAAKGRQNGGPRRFGFEPGDGSGTLTPRPSEVALVESIFEMARDGKSQSAIARELNAAGHRTAKGHAWSQPKIGQVLRDRIWIGELVNYQGTFKVMEPVINPELWKAGQRTLSTKGEHRGRHSQRFLLANGLLRCGCCGSAMRVRTEHLATPDRKPFEHYSCSGRRSGASECKQPAVHREHIDRAVLEYFAQVALDVEGTIHAIADERDRRLADVDAKLAQARKVVADAERQIERLDTMMRDESLTLDEWRRLAAVPQLEAEAAAGAIADLTAEREAVEATLDVADATGEFVERIAALRVAVAGDVASAGGVAATRTALRRVFDGFVLHRADSPEAPRRVNGELMLDATYVLEPRVAKDAQLGELTAGTPIVERTSLELAGVGGYKESGP